MKTTKNLRKYKSKPIPVFAGDLYFERKEDATQFYKQILNSYEIGSVVSDPNDIAALNSLFEMRSDGAEKMGSGVAYYYIANNGWGSHEFRFVRTDGSDDDISYVKTIDGFHKYYNQKNKFGGNAAEGKP